MTNSRRLWIVRHGERLDNVIGKRTFRESPDCVRWDDPPLSLRGRSQAKEVGIRLSTESIQYVFCSPFTRCVQTAAQILSQFSGRKPLLCIEPGLGENLSSCNNPPGRASMKEICQIYPEVNETYKPVFQTLPPEPPMESGCTDRMAVTIRTLLSRYPTGNILLISHGSPIACIHLSLFGKWNYVGQCTIGEVAQESPTSFRLLAWNSKDHLSDKENLHDHEL
ncbi:hypothetical protein WR25_02457 [Diploscapter pachys]|uniref:Uncharacterized protein n=1 Tax=Diploscapter pachys TaxID=2018661 RepID=A0A2A2KKP9_9BILA|nr:hypothetical protein WR25_02457 [Diploscapter pachys]